jgi:MFS family permease
MDFMIYPLVIGTIIALWKVDPGTAGLAGTVTLLASAVGGWLGGYLADRIGRVRTLQLTILWFSCFSLVCAFVQNFDQLLIARALLGLGFGGEWAAGAVLMGEVIRDKYRGRGVGIVQTGWAVGWGASALIYTALYAFLPEAIAWRVLFAIGLLPAVFVFWIRRHIDEPEIFRDARRERPAVGVAHLFSAFRGPHLWTTVKVSLMVAGAQGGGYALGIWMPTYLRTVRGLSATSTGGFLLVQIFSDDPRLYVRADGQHGAVAGRRSAVHDFSGEIPADGTVHDRALPDRGPRHGPGVLLQCGAGDRLVLPNGGRVREPDSAARHDYCRVQCRRFGDYDRDADVVAGNPRPKPREPRSGTGRLIANSRRYGAI